MKSPSPRSCLILEIPEAENAVGRHRETLDASARLGVPAHITVLFPFAPPQQINEAALANLRHLFSGFEAFEVRLTELAWFGEEVLWLAPENPEPIQALTTLVHQAFPDYPPFEGHFSDVIPHLTIAHDCDQPRMAAAERSVAPLLPVSGYVDSVTLMAQAEHDGRWTTKARFPLRAVAN